MRAIKVNQSEITNKLETWKINRDTISKDFVFPNFTKAFEFMSKMAVICEDMKHHPNWTNSYNKLHIELTTHDIGAISNLDIDLAMEIDELFATEYSE